MGSKKDQVEKSKKTIHMEALITFANLKKAEIGALSNTELSQYHSSVVDAINDLGLSKEESEYFYHNLENTNVVIQEPDMGRFDQSYAKVISNAIKNLNYGRLIDIANTPAYKTIKSALVQTSKGKVGEKINVEEKRAGLLGLSKQFYRISNTIHRLNSIDRETPEIQRSSTNTIKKIWKDHLSGSMNEASDGLRNFLAKRGQVCEGDFSKLKENDIIVVANADYGLLKRQWNKHGYIAVVGKNNVIKEIFELGATMTPDPDVKGEIPQKDKEAAKNAPPFLLNMGYDIELTSYHLSKLNHLIEKGRVFKIDIGKTLIEESFNEVVADIKSYKKRYLGPLYSCNHFVYEILKKAFQKNAEKRRENRASNLIVRSEENSNEDTPTLLNSLNL